MLKAYEKLAQPPKRRVDQKHRSMTNPNQPAEAVNLGDIIPESGGGIKTE